jgi:hypothetical protein
MGVIDPMAINSAAATGVIDLGGGVTLWLLAMGVLSGAFGSLLMANARRWRRARPVLPRPRVASAGVAVAGRAQ